MGRSRPHVHTHTQCWYHGFQTYNMYVCFEASLHDLNKQGGTGASMGELKKERGVGTLSTAFPESFIRNLRAKSKKKRFCTDTFSSLKMQKCCPSQGNSSCNRTERPHVKHPIQEFDARHCADPEMCQATEVRACAVRSMTHGGSSSSSSPLRQCPSLQDL